MVAPSSERLRGKGSHGVPCRLNCVIMPERISGLYTMQGAIQVLCFTFLTFADNTYLRLVCSSGIDDTVK